MTLSAKTACVLSNAFSDLAKSNAGRNATCSEGFFIPDEKVIAIATKCFSHFEFAKNINIVMVEDREGRGFLSSIGSPVSTVTDVEKDDRVTSPLLARVMKYNTSKVNTDLHVHYSLINKWAVSSRDFKKSYGKHVTQRVGMDRLIMGWHGKTATGETTNPVRDPMLTGNAVGWLQGMINQFPKQILGGNPADLTNGTVSIGNGGDYSSLDAAVLDAISMIPEILRQDLVCIVGDALIHAEQTHVYSNKDFAFDKHKNAEIFNQYGNIPRVSCPGFPSLGLAVTSINNLSLYIKSSTAFRQINNDPKRETVRDYQTAEIAYIVENPRKFFAFNPAAVSIAGAAAADASFIASEFNKIAANAD